MYGASHCAFVTGGARGAYDMGPNMQVRNAQLSKEARELREENNTLQERVEHQQYAAAYKEKVRELLPMCSCCCPLMGSC